VTPVAVLIMSDGELARAETLRDLDQDRLTIEAAQQLLGLSRRQVFRLLKAYRLQGSAGSPHGPTKSRRQLDIRLSRRRSWLKACVTAVESVFRQSLVDVLERRYRHEDGAA
jgi:hypothetical protein